MATDRGCSHGNTTCTAAAAAVVVDDAEKGSSTLNPTRRSEVALSR
ncbi:hypothetical protein [Williamsia sp.]|nr:hypothetical protein [Williamsia sp.]MBJ7289623.1 hypothetical protein [Williamsia sp.]